MKPLRNLVLIVDDEPDLASVVAEIVQTQGYQTHQCSNGAEALTFWRQHSAEICLVLCDISMPVSSGLDFLKNALGENGYVPMVMITAHSDSDNLSEALRLGAIDYIVKPFSAKALQKQLALWAEIGKRRSDTQGPSSLDKMDALLRIRNSKLKKIS